MFRKKIRMTVLIAALPVGVAFASPPAYWHYYYAYAQPMETCGALIKETVQNIQQNWDLDGGDIKPTSASFVTGNTRGILRCLGRGENSSWVVLIATGGGSKAKTILNDMKVVVCGNC